MVAWSALIVPIVLSVVLVFVASSLIHMVLQWHKPEYRKLPDEEAARAAMRGLSPGEYIVPHCLDPKQMAEPEMARRIAEGPTLLIWSRTPGQMKLGPFLGQWVLYVLVVSCLLAYIARAALAPGAEYLKVFQLVGVTAWLAYCWSMPADAIWKGRPWSAIARYLVDGLVYASLTAGAFAWLWPGA
ncbi:MAG TPA: hypothetical protein VMT18_02040 [Planctomycetota bacterium]|nr:hypothetical protein [Planctomycetota bacterium]